MAPSTLVSNSADGSLTKQSINEKLRSTPVTAGDGETPLQSICYGTALPSMSSNAGGPLSGTSWRASHLTEPRRHPNPSHIRRPSPLGTVPYDRALPALGPPPLHRRNERAHLPSRPGIPLSVVDEPVGGAFWVAAGVRHAPGFR